MLVGVLKAARDINLRLHLPGKAYPVVISLRSDILDELQFNDKNKINDDIEFLEWTDETLVDVISARIARSLACRQEQA
jgi:hypothetical protein